MANPSTSLVRQHALVPVHVRGRPAALYRIPFSLMLMGLLLISIQAGKPLLGLAVMLTALMSTAAVAWRTVARRQTPATALRGQGDRRLVAGDYKEARVLYERALSIAERELPPASPEVLVNYYSLAAVNSMLHDHARADGYLADLMRGLGDRIPPGWTGHVAWLLRRVAHHHSLQGNHDRAVALCHRALDLVGEAPGADDNTVRSLLDDLAWIHHHAGDYAEAESVFGTALAVHEQFRDAARELSCRPTRSSAVPESPYRVPGPATVSTTGGLDRAVAYSLLGLGWTVYERGRYPEARHYFDRAAVVAAAAAGGDGSEPWARAKTNAGLVVEILRGRAAVSVTLGEYEDAHALYERARTTLDAADEPLQVAALDIDVGWLQRCQQEYEDAERTYRRALDGITRAKEGSATIACALYEALAELRRRQGKLREAQRDVRRALELADDCLGAEHPRVAGILAVAARIFAARSEFSEAERAARQCLAVLRAGFGRVHPRFADGYV
ncbi:MAG: tetratricopeptide repeat protein, partial [Myxococcota bacterium]